MLSKISNSTTTDDWSAINRKQVDDGKRLKIPTRTATTTEGQELKK
jgi:hypothetical protein